MNIKSESWRSRYFVILSDHCVGEKKQADREPCQVHSQVEGWWYHKQRKVEKEEFPDGPKELQGPIQAQAIYQTTKSCSEAYYSSFDCFGKEGCKEKKNLMLLFYLLFVFVICGWVENKTIK